MGVLLLKEWLKLSGAKSIHYHILNKESRKYFNRAFMISGTATSPSTPFKYGVNNLPQTRECLGIVAIGHLIEKLKIESATVVARCKAFHMPGDLNMVWIPNIEIKGTQDAFITEAPNVIYASGKAPRMDVVFSFTSQVSSQRSHLHSSKSFEKKTLHF